MSIDVVLDSNVLFRTLISGGEIIYLFFNKDLKIYAPEKLKQELVNNKKEIIKKSKLSAKEFEETVSTLFNVIEFVPISHYASFIPQAKRLLKKHEKDEDFIALCLFKNIRLWTYEKLLFDIGFGISTKQISKNLLKQ